MELGNTAARQLERSFNVPLQILDAGYGAIEEGVASQTETDRNSVSRDGFLLTEALRTAQETPDIRKSKVEALKARIAAGEYKVDSLDLATALVREDGAIFA